jgi:hypothetical protein
MPAAGSHALTGQVVTPRAMAIVTPRLRSLGDDAKTV